jgi:hypothetical protein
LPHEDVRGAGRGGGRGGGAAGGQEEEKAALKFTMKHLDKGFGLTGKAVRLIRTEAGFQEYVIRLEFRKDAEDLTAVQAAFRAIGRGESGMALVHVYLFDEENVAVQKLVISRVEGEVTGKKGDAFRVYAAPGDGDLAKVRRVEVRSDGLAKKKEEKKK